jgi:hypothetical protein
MLTKSAPIGQFVAAAGNARGIWRSSATISSSAFLRRRPQSQIWDASSVAALDSIETKYREHGATVSFTGLDQRSSSFHQRLTGQLGA